MTLYLGLDPSRYVHSGKLVHYPIIRTDRIKELPPLKPYSHILFTSPTAVRHWFSLTQEPLLNVLAIGEATAGELKRRGIDPVIAPFATQEGVMALLETLDVSFLLWPRSSKARPLLEMYLKRRKISYQMIDLYNTVTEKGEAPPDWRLFDRIVFTSPSTVRAFIEIYGKLPDRKKIVSIGPVTQSVVAENFSPEISSNAYSANFEIKENSMADGGKMGYQLPELPYDFNALEPVISAEIMEIHYTKHHKAYVTNLNTALEKYHEAETKNDMPSMIALQQAIKFNGGGHINHSIFWTILAPVSKGGGKGPSGELLKMIERDFGSFDSFKEKFSAATVGIHGSGWGWLGFNKNLKRLELATCANQDPLSTQGLVPILGADVWEHAYYLQYKNVRADYVKALWQIFNWKNIEERFTKANI